MKKNCFYNNKIFISLMLTVSFLFSYNSKILCSNLIINSKTDVKSASISQADQIYANTNCNMFGDTSCDGKVDSKDYLILMNYVHNKSSIHPSDQWLKMADVSGNGDVGIEDCKILKNYLLKKISSLPYYIGNTSGNIVNSGTVCKNGNWIYYCDQYSTGRKLCKVKPDGTGKVIISNDWARYINVANGWIYYENCSDNNKLYKIKVDGSCKTKINDNVPYCLTVLRDDIYYVNGCRGSLCKVKSDGSCRTELGPHGLWFMSISNNRIYYSVGSGMNATDTFFYRINCDGAENTKIDGISIYSWDACIDGDWIYYNNLSDNNTDNLNLFKAKLDGSSKTNLYAIYPSNINVSEGWIYYSSIPDHFNLCKIKTDGSNKTILNSDITKDVNILDDTIYYGIGKVNSAGFPVLYKINKDGTGRVQMDSDDVYAP